MKIEKLLIISTNHKLNKVRINRGELGEFECKYKNALWGEEDERFYLVLEKFGFDIGVINETSTGPEKIFRF